MSWRQQAACRNQPTALFFGAEDESVGARRVRERLAKKVCGVCRVRAECALEGRDEEGIWGGLTRSERLGRSRTRHVLDRPIVADSDANPWVVIDMNGRVALWQRDNEANWHGTEWAVVQDGVMVQILDDLNLAYLKFADLVGSGFRQ
jgi:WhiB family redox-sensing transcriptional regulator